MAGVTWELVRHLSGATLTVRWPAGHTVVLPLADETEAAALATALAASRVHLAEVAAYHRDMEEE